MFCNDNSKILAHFKQTELHNGGLLSLLLSTQTVFPSALHPTHPTISELDPHSPAGAVAGVCAKKARHVRPEVARPCTSEQPSVLRQASYWRRLSLISAALLSLRENGTLPTRALWNGPTRSSDGIQRGVGAAPVYEETLVFWDGCGMLFMFMSCSCGRFTLQRRDGAALCEERCLEGIHGGLWRQTRSSFCKLRRTKLPVLS